MKKLFTFILALAASIGLINATVVTITEADIQSSSTTLTKGVVTLTVANIDSESYSITGGGTFTTESGRFTRINVLAGYAHTIEGGGWSGNSMNITWTGTSSIVSFSGNILAGGFTITCTLVTPADVIALIDAIGTVEYTEECYNKISAAWDAYDLLSAEDRALITNYQTLIDATDAYYELAPATWLSIDQSDLIRVKDLLEVPENDTWVINDLTFIHANSPYQLLKADINGGIIENENGAYYVFKDHNGTYYIEGTNTATTDGLLVTAAEDYNYTLVPHEPFGDCGENLNWAFDAATGNLTISGNGAMTDWEKVKDVAWACYRNNNKVHILSLTISAGVTSIGNHAFEECFDVTNIELPEGITTIGTFAFRIANLKTINIPASVTTIKENAFYGCQNMTDVYCYPDAASLSWTGEKNDFKGDGSTVMHVKPSQLSAYQTKFADVLKVTYAGDLPETPTGVENVQRDNVPCTKEVRNGQLLIIRDGKTYNALGAEVR